MNRLLVVRCPDLLCPDEGGASGRVFAAVVEAVEATCPWVAVVRPGVCSLPVRGPARYFGGEGPLVDLISGATADLTRVEVGVADGLFAAELAARTGAIVPAGGTPGFLAPMPVDILGRPELTELLDRLGIRTLGAFAALPESHVLGRLGADGVRCHRVAGGRSDRLEDGAPATAGRRGGARRADGRDTGAVVVVPEFWGGVSDTDARAARALAAVQDLIGADGVVMARLQGGRGPAQRARLVTWNGGGPDGDPAGEHRGEHGGEHRGEHGFGAPWPGQIPPPAPAVVHPHPLGAELVDGDGHPVSVSGRGLLTAVPARLSVEQRPWARVQTWAGPWPSDERWWSRSRRRSARIQVVTAGTAHLLLVEQGRWWVEATYR